MPSAIDAAMLATMRSLITSDLLPDTCVINSIVVVPDGEGGQTTQSTAVATVACRLDVVSGHEQVSGGAIQPFMAYKLSLPYDTVITESNQVAVNGEIFTVQSVNVGQSWKAVVRVDLERL